MRFWKRMTFCSFRKVGSRRACRRWDKSELKPPAKRWGTAWASASLHNRFVVTRIFSNQYLFTRSNPHLFKNALHSKRKREQEQMGIMTASARAVKPRFPFFDLQV